jgi:Mor family transcriptional regulator
MVVDVAEFELKKRPDSALLVRPLTYLIAQEFGGLYQSLGRIDETAKFVNNKRIYDLWNQSPEAARQAASEMHIRGYEIAQILEHQQLCQAGAKSVTAWQRHIAGFLELIEEALHDIVKSEPERWLIKKAMVRGFSSAAEHGCGAYFPTCNLMRSRLQALLIREHLKTSTGRNTARHFGISQQHVYRLVEVAKQWDKEECGYVYTPRTGAK